eukprot:TRINITY_DN2082_c0_g1_i3.p1 TRINITY_DN2082_c0_g1~~TRINITY_DN2082_c0_g1_i3.p1  ORF type:complete len:378 (-),score=83.08 TRINITY_DN2082_c0_g1_i3:11-1144(-)
MTTNETADNELWELQQKLCKETNLKLEYTHPSQSVETQKKQEDKPQKKFKWSVDHIDNNYKVNFATAVAWEDIKNIPWEEGIKGAQRSEAGSEGVYFVELNKSGLFVVKPSKSIGEEVFSNILSLKLGVYSPQLRILYGQEKEGNRLLDLVIEKDKSGIAVHGLLQSEYLLMKQFIPGKNLDKFEYDQMFDIFGDHYDNYISDESKRRLIELSEVLALDIITNNSDRLPLIWNNPGNPGNIMITNQGQIISVENTVTTFELNDKAFETYKETVESLLSDLVEKQGVENEKFKFIITKLYEFTGYPFGKIGTLTLQGGFLDVLRRSVNIDLEKEINDWKLLLNKFSPPLVGLNNLKTDFIISIWTIFQKYGKILSEKK